MIFGPPLCCMRCKHGWKIEPQNSRLFCTNIKYYLEQEKKYKWIKEGFSGLGCTSFIQIFTAIAERSTLGESRNPMNSCSGFGICNRKELLSTIIIMLLVRIIVLHTKLKNSIARNPSMLVLKNRLLRTDSFISNEMLGRQERTEVPFAPIHLLA